MSGMGRFASAGVLCCRNPRAASPPQSHAETEVKAVAVRVVGVGVGAAGRRQEAGMGGNVRDRLTTSEVPPSSVR